MPVDVPPFEDKLRHPIDSAIDDVNQSIKRLYKTYNVLHGDLNPEQWGTDV